LLFFASEELILKRTIVTGLLFSIVFFIHAASAGAADPIRLRVLTANVGNADIMNCAHGYFNKLCLVKWEKPIADGIAKLSPDIVALQEVFDTKWCGKIPPEKNKNKVCYKYMEREPAHQARRLLGPDYTIVCEDRSGFECLGVRKTLGEVAGCAAGELCIGKGAINMETPEGCDTGPSIFGIDVSIAGDSIRVTNAHPSASSRDCRSKMIIEMFDGNNGENPIADASIPTLVMGDLNMDPYNWPADYADVAAWIGHVGVEGDFHYLSGVAEHDPPYPTAAGRVIDQFISNIATGTCKTLGAAPDTQRLDGYPMGKPIQDAPDHLAIFCEIEIPIADDASDAPNTAK
jgi:hypothetical protein